MTDLVKISRHDFKILMIFEGIILFKYKVKF